MGRLSRGKLILLLLIAIAAEPARAQLPTQGQSVPQLASVDTLLQNFILTNNIPGGEVAITHNGAVVYERSFGYTSAARNIGMPETEMMRLASVSKPITAAAINKLATDGKLNLDARVFKIGSNGGLLDIPPAGALGDSRLQNI